MTAPWRQKLARLEVRCAEVRRLGSGKFRPCSLDYEQGRVSTYRERLFSISKPARETFVSTVADDLMISFVDFS